MLHGETLRTLVYIPYRDFPVVVKLPMPIWHSTCETAISMYETSWLGSWVNKCVGAPHGPVSALGSSYITVSFRMTLRSKSLILNSNLFESIDEQRAALLEQFMVLKPRRSSVWLLKTASSLSVVLKPVSDLRTTITFYCKVRWSWILNFFESIYEIPTAMLELPVVLKLTLALISY